MKITFITGNHKKAEFLSKYLDYPIAHKELDLDELQSLSLNKIVEHKARQAYSAIRTPVLVEDVSFIIKAQGNLPGPFIKWFIEEIGYEGLCRLADSDPKRQAITQICYAFFDGDEMVYFDGQINGSMPLHPTGDDGFGFNCVFIPEGQTKTNAQMSADEVAKYSIRTATVYPKIKQYLDKLQ